MAEAAEGVGTVESGFSISSAIKEGDHYYATSANEDIKELARTMVAVADVLLKPRKPEKRLSKVVCHSTGPKLDQVDLETDAGVVEVTNDRFHHHLSTLVDILQEVLRFLETPAGNYWSERIREREGVLRGLLNLTAVGSVILSFGLMYLANKYLALSNDSYKAERNYITQCLQDIEGKQDFIGKEISKAAEIIQEIMQNIQRGALYDNINLRALEFDHIISQVKTEVEICQKKLDEIESTLLAVKQKVHARRWFYAGVKSACVAAAVYGIYKIYEKEKISTVTAVGTSLGILVIWSLTTTSDGSELFEKLISLQYQIKRGNQKLDDLRDRLTCHEQAFDKLKKAKDDQVNVGNRLRSI